jgi:ABC-2 type transport system ATP-binding protein
LLNTNTGSLLCLNCQVWFSLFSFLHKSCQLIIFDEPTVGLDPHIRHQLWQHIRNLKQEGKTIILTTHYLDEAEALADRVCILDRGTIRIIDTLTSIMSTYNKTRLEDVFIQLAQENGSNNPGAL